MNQNNLDIRPHLHTRAPLCPPVALVLTLLQSREKKKKQKKRKEKKIEEVRGKYKEQKRERRCNISDIQKEFTRINKYK